MIHGGRGRVRNSTWGRRLSLDLVHISKWSCWPHRQCGSWSSRSWPFPLSSSQYTYSQDSPTLQIQPLSTPPSPVCPPRARPGQSIQKTITKVVPTSCFPMVERDIGLSDQSKARGFVHPPPRDTHTSHNHILQVVLIHGLSIPAIVWKDVAPVLASRGYRVLLYDLYGRGYSDAPDVTYDVSLHTTQLALLMQHIKWDDAYVVGLSMGGGIATAFAVQFPHLVNGKVALSADISRTAKFMSSPFVQSVSSLPPFRHYMRLLVNGSEVHAINPIQEIVRLQSAHLPHYNAAVASSLRDGPVRGLAHAFRALSNSSNEILLIHGTADKTVPYKYTFKIQALVPQAKLVTIVDGGHDITVTHANEVNTALLHFL
ncbi:Alpha/Beta hydrolase protein [Boletus reticuloceps]|uniref:Alpha/Beta hydrolase protein n=1 Tax=Boletus reticuloceps TaxID=495285 RepID=A0A8I3A8I8_9AGAM|nr:Alpha/Beta hydrolase protein [Boletus reticuloceps]